ncbi:MAG: CDP-alcohol phosphatidyltransferase family protein [Candidatus Nanopelagicaceae bacterium]|nr:CDP-alcohol phosphatidyltransferase family protein [Candidatus Nanopelagicaceae bacterium]
MISKKDFYKRWSELHSNAEISGIVHGWLAISYRLALIATLLRISPNVLTLLGLASAIGTAVIPHSYWAIALVALSLLFDGIDGSVAIFQRRESAWGATLDSVADRISEAAWAYALYQVGIPLEIAVGLWLAASVQEYARARLSALGVKDLGIVTFAERPMRASLLFLILVAWQLELPGLAIIAGVFLLVQVIGALQVMRFGYQQLR